MVANKSFDISNERRRFAFHPTAALEHLGAFGADIGDF